MSLASNRELKYPEKEALDVAVEKAIELAANPISAIARTIVDSVRGNIEQHRAEYFHRLTARVNEHETRLSDLEFRLSDTGVSDRQTSATYQMFDAYLRTHDEDKKRALVNASANVLLNPPESELEENEFLEFLGLPSFNVFHIRILKLFSTEEQGVGLSGLPGSIAGRIERHRNYFGLDVGPATIDRVWEDLTSRGFLNGGRLATVVSDGGAAKRTTELGDKFLAFIDK